jgi:uncharacterized membrane protein YccC
MRRYFETLGPWWIGQPAANKEATIGPNATAATQATQASPATAPQRLTPADRDFRFRLARKNAHVAFANLGQAFRRMMLEPKTHQKFVPEFNDLLVQTHVLAAQITAVAPLMREVTGEDAVVPTALERALTAVRENLARAQDGEAAFDQAETTKQLTRELDSMVVEIEKSESPPERVHELKMLALQCKQMLAASFLIRKDAAAIRLPA